MVNLKYSRQVILFVFSTLLAFSPLFGQASRSEKPIPGIKADVIVRRDARSVPYIEASTDADLYFIQGYVTASDRLWQMDLLRRVARGETAEIFGRSVLDEDRRWRRFGFAKIAEESLRHISPKLRSALDNYARGVNAYIATLDDQTIPIEFKILQYKPRDWTAADTIVIGKVLSDALSTTWRIDLVRSSLQSIPKEKLADLTNQVTPYDVVLFGKDAPAAPVVNPRQKPGMAILDAADRDLALRERSLSRVGLYAEELAASNNWVVAGARTADGRPLLANDPHLQPSAPGIWYMVSLSTPKMHVAGVTFPGVPGVVLGHNDSIAWGATNVGPDVQDLYSEKFDSEGRYLTPTGWVEPKKRTEVIKFRPNPLKPETESVSFEVTETRHGPIILEDAGNKYALRWTALDPKNSEFETFFGIDRVRNWQEFKNSIKTYGGASQNFIYADVKGNIGWYVAGKIPLRRTGDGSLPYDGSTADGDWIGSIPFDELPNLYNPPGGIIVTANQRTVGTTYKYPQMWRDAAAPWRARRILDSLNSKQKLTMDDVREIQLDVLNIPLLNLSKEIVKRQAASTDTLKDLQGWDGRMIADSRAALLVNEIRGCLADKIAAENRPVPAAAIRERVLDWAVRDESKRWLPAAFHDYGAFLASCDTFARTSLADPKRFGPDDSKWVWGNVVRSRFPHPLASAPLIGGQFAIQSIPINGSGQTPNVGPFVSMRLIASPGNWDLTRQVIPLGESGDPRSPFYRDQFEAWRTGAPQLFPFSRAAVRKAAVSVTVFKKE